VLPQYRPCRQCGRKLEKTGKKVSSVIFQKTQK
jgi:hypothetical protein